MQDKYRVTVSIRDIGSYEVIAGILAREHVRFFTRKTVAGEWELAKIIPTNDTIV